MIDTYRTVHEPASARITRKRSRFIGLLHPVSSPAKVQIELQRIRRTYHDATHVCYAYRLLGGTEPVSFFDDAGEPSGSAGLPILQQLEKAELLNVLGVVIRYFGGTKLGVGGLVRAYSDTTQAILKSAHIVVRRLAINVSVHFPPKVTSGVMGAIHRYGANVIDMQYDSEGRAVVALPPSRVAEFIDGLKEGTGAQATAEVIR